MTKHGEMEREKSCDKTNLVKFQYAIERCARPKQQQWWLLSAEVKLWCTLSITLFLRYFFFSRSFFFTFFIVFHASSIFVCWICKLCCNYKNMTIKSFLFALFFIVFCCFSSLRLNFDAIIVTNFTNIAACCFSLREIFHFHASSCSFSFFFSIFEWNESEFKMRLIVMMATIN